jgi:2-deoxy-D-gluconate 3-dehydrogenase
MSAEPTGDAVAVITGASGAIGSATVPALVGAGWAVIAVARGQEKLLRLEHALAEAGITGVETMQGDVSSEGDVERLAAAAVGRGRFDLLVNAAGWAPWGPAVDVPHAVLTGCLRTNIEGTFLMSVAAARAMERGAAIINVASTLAFKALANRSVYGATKAAVAYLTRALAIEWAERGIAVNAVAPGVVLTSEVQRLLDSGSPAVADLDQATISGTLATPEDIAQAIVTLASQSRQLVTGQVWSFDAGWGLI